MSFYNRLAPNVVRGGTAIPLGNNFYYMRGRKHKNGGIDIGENPKTGLEVEGGEVMEMRPNEVRVYSSVPFLNGQSPAKLVLGGANPETVFNAQEQYKDRNKLNDDGTKKAKYGKQLKKNNMIATINGNVKNGLIHTTMKCGGRKKAAYGSYDNMRGIGRANYSLKANIDRELRDVLSRAEAITSLDLSNIKSFSPTSLERNLTDKEKEDIVKNIIAKEKQYAKGNAEIVSPEFDALFLARGLASGAGSGTIGLIKSGYDLARNASERIKYNKKDATEYNFYRRGKSSAKPKTSEKPKTEPKKEDIKIDLGNVDKNKVNEFTNRNKPTPKVEKYTPTSNRNSNIDWTDASTVTEHSSGLHYGKPQMINTKKPYEPIVRRKMDDKISRELDRIYRKAVGNKPPRSGFEFKHAPTEIQYTPTNSVTTGRTYDPYMELRRLRSKEIYNELGRKYGRRNVDRFMKENNITKYKYGGRKKADLGLSYYAKSLFGENYDKVIDLNPDGTRSERSLLYADAAKPYRTYGDLILNNEFKGYSTLGDFSNRRIKYAPTIITKNTPTINEEILTPIKTKTSVPSNNSTSSKVNTKSVTTKSSVPTTVEQREVLPTISRVPSRLAGTSMPITKTINLPKGTIIPYSANNSYNSINPLRGVRPEDWISLGTNLASTIGGSLIGANAEVTAPELPEVTAPTLITPGNLKTYFNINPQLASINRTALSKIADINRNTGSSRTALARKQRIANQAVADINNLYGQKENIETELYNKNVANKQTVAAQNAQIYNNYLNNVFNRNLEQVKLKYAADSENIRNKAIAYNNLLSGANASIQDLIARLETRRKDKNTLAAVAARSKDAAEFIKTLKLFE